MNRVNSGLTLLAVTVIGLAVIILDPPLPRIDVPIDLIFVYLVLVPCTILTWSGVTILNSPKPN